jgi:predicted lipoprotein with Yx(FWY)xxD motif
MRTGYARAGRLAALAAGVVVVVAACGGGATPSPAATKAPATPAPSTVPSVAPSAAPTAAPSSSPAASAGVDEYELTVATSATAGKYLAGKDGRTLYTFKKDTGPTSTCYDACATAWPPFVVAAGAKVKGEDGVTGTFATTDRTDGTKQVTYNGAPPLLLPGRQGRRRHDRPGPQRRLVRRRSVTEPDRT